MNWPDGATKVEKKRFNDSYKITSSCWEWTRTLNYGYGVFHFEYKRYRAHRFMWELHNGKIPKGLLVRHLCHNRKCVNPDHLMTGTNRDNSDDMLNAGRQRKGEDVNTAKLNESQVLEILQRFSIGKHTKQALSEDYNVSRSTISLIVNGKIWKHLCISPVEKVE